MLDGGNMHKSCSHLKSSYIIERNDKANRICSAWFVHCAITYYLQSPRHKVFRPFWNFVCFICTMLIRLCTFRRWKSCHFMLWKELFIFASTSKHKTKPSLFSLTFKSKMAIIEFCLISANRIMSFIHSECITSVLIEKFHIISITNLFLILYKVNDFFSV